MTRTKEKTAVTSGGLQELPTPTKESARSLASYPANRGTGKVRRVGCDHPAVVFGGTDGWCQDCGARVGTSDDEGFLLFKGRAA